MQKKEKRKKKKNSSIHTAFFKLDIVSNNIIYELDILTWTFVW